MAASNGFTAAAQSGDPGWPRVFKSGGKQLTVYQPQVDYWHGYTNLHFRCAIAVKGVSKQEKFGVAEIAAVTAVDQAARTVVVTPTARDLRFPNTSDSEAAALRRAVDELRPPGHAITISLDRVLAYLNVAEQRTQHPVEVNLDPPQIFYSRQPAILVIFLGEPQFKPVETNRTDLLFALNTNWDLFYDTASQRYYLLNQDQWLTAPDVKGPWTATQNLPTSLFSLPANDNWADVRANLPAKRAKAAPVVFVSTQPAELILTRGDPTYSPIPGTRLLRVANTEDVLFRNSGDEKFYFLVAGRWFRAPSLDGPWSAASKDLPADFARIPENDPAAFVKASVPGTRDAQDAVLLASVPATTTVNVTNPTVKVVYNGPPQFKPIETTTVQYAVNSPYSVFLVDGKYYCCDQGVWFVSPTANGPWAFCTSVPAAIYTIPPSSPMYHVTYVVVQSSTPTTVVYSQTAGYSGEYVAATGVLMFGVGMFVGAAVTDHHDYYYYPPPIYYSYGCGAVYHYGYGGYYSAGHAWYGPYGGAGYATAYNPATGTYSRGAYAYGPYGNAGVKQAYNPYTGGYARAAQVNTAYGSAGRGAAYNPSTGNAAWGGYRSSSYGTVGGVRTSQGTGAAAWDTQQGQGAVAKGQGGNYYAAKDGTVYKRDSSGNWSQNTGSGWESTARPTPNQTPSTTSGATSRATTQNLESQAQARNWGNQQSQRVQSWQASGGARGGVGVSRGGGGRRR